MFQDTQIQIDGCNWCYRAITDIGPDRSSGQFLGYWLLIGICGEEFAKTWVLGMAFLLIDNREIGPQCGLKHYQKMVHIVIETVTPCLRPKTWIRRIRRVEVAAVFLVETADQRAKYCLAMECEEVQRHAPAGCKWTHQAAQCPI